ncbi:hypothetical protein [Shewanella chilikensis]|uniref:hypothetical protein n=1 Tax=Shewanella chilikensis TaxID=558541 RepID=UPI003A988268
MKFNDGNFAKKFYTIGELKEIIEELPDDARVEQGFEDCCDIVIFHDTDGNPHIEFQEGGDWSDD